MNKKYIEKIDRVYTSLLSLGYKGREIAFGIEVLMYRDDIGKLEMADIISRVIKYIDKIEQMEVL